MRRTCAGGHVHQAHLRELLVQAKSSIVACTTFLLGLLLLFLRIQSQKCTTENVMTITETSYQINNTKDDTIQFLRIKEHHSLSKNTRQSTVTKISIWQSILASSSKILRALLMKPNELNKMLSERQTLPMSAPNQQSGKLKKQKNEPMSSNFWLKTLRNA